MTIKTEKATEQWDLLHPYIADRAHPDSECRCGRARVNQLHGAPSSVTEQASHSAPLQTEKGS